ncbi:HD domain-containing protein [Pseudogracilibacillus sp. SE30717A]|uniref:HD domain-containing protein n=1 Tax=Pseudogracilibacillus sp. SE30717A TaxID=3098293 RepID=UPI003FA6D002
MVYKTELLDEVKVFKDPVHRYVRVSDRVIWDLIATPEFQRLRRIKQLGTTYLTFHGAEHSRFNHSLGVYEIVRRMINKMETQEGWNHEERLVSLCAALLHDLGHGPFSHSFEKVFNLDHEDFTKRIILEDTNVNTILNRVERGFPEKVAQIIDKTYEDKLVISIISSQIDADRMDYLLRDAYYTGVSYGQFDMERILRVMRPTKDQIVIKSTGMHAVEDYIMSRYQMYWQVYFHPVTRSAEVILTKIFHRAKDLYQQGYQFEMEPTLLLSFFKNEVKLKDYLQLDEPVIYYYFQRWQNEKDEVLSDLCTRFINRCLFKYVEYNPEKHKEQYENLKDLFYQADIDPNYYLVIDSSSDLPYDVYRAGEGRVPIYLQMPSGEKKELSTHSVIVDSITGKTREDHKMYFPAEKIDLISNSKLKEQIKKLLYYRS